VTALQLLPAILSLLLLAAHFLRGGNSVLVGAALALIAALGVRRAWVARIVPAALLLGAAEWARTLIVLAGTRQQAGMPAARMALILGGVALFTALSALIFRSARVRGWFRIP